MADNDLAVGKIVDEISHSKYWKDSAIFVVEDDSQDGADHVDGHRAPVQVISPWAQHGVVDSTYYSQITMVRTIEQILGAQPLNQKLAAATPMFGAFTNKPDFTPFTAVPNQVPLTEGVSPAPTCGPRHPGPRPAPRRRGQRAVGERDRRPRRREGVADQWADMGGQAAPHRRRPPVPDYANPEQMNRYTWYRAHGWTSPTRVTRGSTPRPRCPGGYIPGARHTN